VLTLSDSLNSMNPKHVEYSIVGDQISSAIPPAHQIVIEGGPWRIRHGSSGSTPTTSTGTRRKTTWSGRRFQWNKTLAK
jgi:hypothetical protein